MSDEKQEQLLDLLIKKAVYGLDESEQKELDGLDNGTADLEFRSLELTAAAISTVDYDPAEQLPAHLQARIADEAEKHVIGAAPWPPAYRETEESRGSSWFGWFGWAAAAAACVALAVNIYLTQFRPPVEVAKAPVPAETPRPLTVAEQREAMLRTAQGVITASWSLGNMKELKDLVGDIVWSDEKQQGFMRFRGLPVNDATKETYQLWIFDKTQDKATPIDGGVFDVTEAGEVIIPIEAKLKAQEPSMFAITVEKPGGVVVSKREKIAALATVEAKTTS